MRKVIYIEIDGDDKDVESVSSEIEVFSRSVITEYKLKNLITREENKVDYIKLSASI